MPALSVGFGEACYEHVQSGIEAVCQATVELRTEHERLQSHSMLHPSFIQDSELWTRRCSPLIFHATYAFDRSLPISVDNLADMQQVLTSAISMAELWKSMDLEVTSHTQTAYAKAAEASTIAISLELSNLQDSVIESTQSSAKRQPSRRPDVNEINCPQSVPQAALEAVRTVVRFRRVRSDDGSSSTSRSKSLRSTLSPAQRDGSGGTHSTLAGGQSSSNALLWLVPLIDACLRSFLSRRKSKVAAGIKLKQDGLQSSLQECFPAIFIPGCQEAISSRARVVASISKSLQGYVRRTGKTLPSINGARLQSRSHSESGLVLHSQDIESSEAVIQRCDWSTLMQFIGASHQALQLPPLTLFTKPGTDVQMSNEPQDTTDLLSLTEQPRISPGVSDDLATVGITQSGNQAERATDVWSMIGATFPNEAQVNVQARPQWPWLESNDYVWKEQGLLEDLPAPTFHWNEPCSSHESIKTPDCHSENDNCRSVDAQWSHSSRLMEEGSLFDHDIGYWYANDAQGSSKFTPIGATHELSQTTTRWNPSTPCRGMPYSGQQLEAANESFNCDASDVLTSSFPHHFAIEESYNPDSEVALQQAATTPFNQIRTEHLVYLKTEDTDFSDLFDLDKNDELLQSPPTIFASPEVNQTAMSHHGSSRQVSSQQRPPPLRVRTEGEHEKYIDSRPSSKRSSTVSTISSLATSPTSMSMKGGKLLRRLSRRSKDQGQEDIDIDLSNLGSRTMEVKRRKTLDDYDLRDGLSSEEESDDMLFH